MSKENYIIEETLHREGIGKLREKRTVVIKIVLVIYSTDLYWDLPPWTVPRMNLFGSILLAFA